MTYLRRSLSYPIMIHFNKPFSRQQILHLMALNQDQPAWVPKFTKVGFEKVKIPAEIYQMLIKEYERIKPGMRVETCARAVINCEQIVDDDYESSLRTSKRTFIMELRYCVNCKTEAAD